MMLVLAEVMIASASKPRQMPKMGKVSPALLASSASRTNSRAVSKKVWPGLSGALPPGIKKPFTMSNLFREDHKFYVQRQDMMPSMSHYLENESKDVCHALRELAASSRKGHRVSENLIEVHTTQKRSSTTLRNLCMDIYIYI